MAWLYKQFIPHEDNDHKPHFLRPKSAARILGFIVCIEVILLSQVYVFPQFKDFLAAVLPGVLVDLTNNSRADADTGDLTVNPLLVISAQQKAEHMARNGYFAHDSPTGESPWFWFDKSGYKFLYAGENLAVHFTDSEDVHRAWMASQTHRANILNPNFTEIGIGIAQGVFLGGNALFIVEHFGRPTQEAPPSVDRPPLAVGTGMVNEEKRESKIVSGEFTGSITIPKTNFIKKILSMPNNLVAFAYYFALFLVTIALILKIFIKIEIQHPRLILAGLTLLFVTSGFIAVNYYLLTLPGQV